MIRGKRSTGGLSSCLYRLFVDPGRVHCGCVQFQLFVDRVLITCKLLVQVSRGDTIHTTK
jgi:hypothetical protein